MEMRKFIIEIHPDGTLTCCEYEDPSEAAKKSNNHAWAEGYRQALIHCNEQVKILEANKGACPSYDLMCQGAAMVRDVISSNYSKYYNKY